ncbi:MAG: quinone oxidoreductase [Acidimicrobiia bacterium]|nr:quinone oxidoreductase [Acidimicrobiia bacterium]
MKSITIQRTGGSEVLEIHDVAIGEPGPSDVVIDVAAAGVNFIDTYHRSGLYPVELPYVLGQEGAGTVTVAGRESGLAVGDRVAWCGVAGSYAEQVLISGDRLVQVPGSVSLETAAAAMLQGLTAYYLVNDTFPLASGDLCLVHAGAGGVGRLLTQLAKAKGATVFATVGSDAKAEISRASGADHVINYSTTDFGAAIEEIAGPHAISVVYDGVGAATFDKGLDLLRPRGMMVTFGNASGPPDPVDPLRLSRGGSLFLTRPSLFHHIATRDEFQQKSEALFGLIADGTLDVLIGERFALEDAKAAHDALEGRGTVGKVILIP